MKERIRDLRTFFIDQKTHHALRQEQQRPDILAEQFERENTPALQRAVCRVALRMQHIPIWGIALFAFRILYNLQVMWLIIISG